MIPREYLLWLEYSSRKFHLNISKGLYVFLWNSLLHSNSILWPSSESTLAQIMACFLTAPTYYLKRCWLIIEVFCGIHPRAISQEVLMNLICNICLEITLPKLLQYVPGANELMKNQYWFRYWHVTEFITKMSKNVMWCQSVHWGNVYNTIRFHVSSCHGIWHNVSMQIFF